MTSYIQNYGIIEKKKKGKWKINGCLKDDKSKMTKNRILIHNAKKK